jgi:hypothetical protein
MGRAVTKRDEMRKTRSLEERDGMRVNIEGLALRRRFKRTGDKAAGGKEGVKMIIISNYLEW